ncbi:MAG: MoaD/ThiS family protein [Gammaproteobacteria bacterium]
MQITLKLYATLQRYLPSNAGKHAVRIQVDPSDSPRKVLDRFQVPPEQSHLVLLNGVYLSPEEREKAKLRDGDTLAVWPPVAGG